MRAFLCLAAMSMPVVAHAEEDSCATVPTDPSTRAMQVKLAFPDDEVFTYSVLAPARGAAFPAVSKDRKTIVQLFAEAAGGSGAPISTLVFWSTSGNEIARFTLEGDWGDPRPKRKPGVVTAHERAVAKAANARLRKTTWRPLAVHHACDPANPTDVALDGTQIQIGADDTLSLDPSSGALTRTRRGEPPTPLGITLPYPGLELDLDNHRVGCGKRARLEYAFGSRDLGLVVFGGGGDLGGDLCGARLEVETAVVLRLR